MSSKLSNIKENENTRTEKSGKQRVINSKEFGTVIIGVSVALIFTVLFRIITALYNDLASNDVFSESVLTIILGVIVSDISDEVIYGLGCAIIIIAAFTGKKYIAVIATAIVSIELFIDYSASYVIDYLTVMIRGTEIFIAVYLALNFVLRSIIYALIAAISLKIFKKNTDLINTPLPVISKRHPTNIAILWAVIIRMAIFIVYELYSNITGFIEYGFDLTVKDVVSIIGAYLEILIRAAVDYLIIFASYTLLSLRNIDKKTPAEQNSS